MRSHPSSPPSRTRAVVPTILALAAMLQALPAAGDDDPERWLTYKELRGSLRAGGADSDGQIGPLLTNINTNVEVEGKFVLKRVEIDKYWSKVEFRGPLTGKLGYRSSMQGVKTENFDSDFASVCSSAIGADSEVKLIVDYGDGTYTLQAWANGKCATNRVHIEAQGTATDADMGEVLANVTLPFEVLLAGGLPLPKSGKAITASVPVLLQAGLTPAVEGRGQWWIETDPAKIEVSVEPENGYLTWVPEGDLRFPDKAAKWLEVKVKVREKDSGEPARAKLKFAFSDVSREPGVCLNHPQKGASDQPDLKLRFGNAQLGTPSPDGTSIETRDKVEELTLIVDAYDFAAWGVLQISGTDSNGESVAVKVRGKDTSELRIPLDDDRNHIADSWKPGIAKGSPKDADEEHQEGNAHDGDGLTLYEEYRGFVEAGERIEGDPEKKDFFVVNLIGAQAKGGLKLFAEATQLKVHSEFNPEELSVHSRVVNQNSSSAVKQHAVVLTRWVEDPGYSKADGGPGTPAQVTKVQISGKPLERARPIPGTAYTEADWEVAHELSHAASVWHHGEGDPEDLVYKPKGKLTATEYRKGQQTEVQLLREAGTSVDFEGKAQITVWLGRQGGQHSGGEQCLMRYQMELAAYEAPAAFGEGSVPVRYLVADQPAGTTLCRNRQVNDFNGPKHMVTTYTGKQLALPRWGEAAPGRGNCWSQINVNDRKPTPR